jgi:hypothetical protein
MYIYGQGDEATAQNHYENLVQMTCSLARLMERIIEKKIGADAFQGFVKEFEK